MATNKDKLDSMPLNEGYSYRRVLDLSAIGESTLSYLVRNYPHSTELEWRARLACGQVVLNDRTANGSETLSSGSILIWNRPGWKEPDTPQSFTVIYQDKYLLAVDKPSGLPTLPGAGFYRNTLLTQVRAHYPDASPLHRLGRATSGLVLFALQADVASQISKQWSRIIKQYLALARHVATDEIYDIQSPIGTLHHPRLGTVHGVSASGKKARSVARAIERRYDSTLFEVDLHTGRPHQIRIHLASIGHPLVGDPLYGVGGIPKVDDPGLPGDAGYFLHAKRLVFVHPVTGRELDLKACPPQTLCCQHD
jgi:23S rRNA pseudouridine1911/1915/1917 synthase